MRERERTRKRQRKGEQQNASAIPEILLDDILKYTLITNCLYSLSLFLSHTLLLLVLLIYYGYDYYSC